MDSRERFKVLEALAKRKRKDRLAKEKQAEEVDS